MNVQVLEKDKEGNNVSFILKGSTPAFANTLRRVMMTEVPTMAIEHVEIRKNDSLLYDEMVAHRLGLVSLKTDLKSYELPGDYESVEELSARQHLKLTLKAKGDSVVYASDIKSTDPKVVPVFPKTVVAKLLKGQDLEIEATAILGKGKEHVKWSPCLAYYSYKPDVTVNNGSSMFEEYKDKYPEAVFDKNGKIDKKAIVEHGLIDACDGVCGDIVKVDYDDTSFVFTVESWGQLTCKEIAVSACDVIQEKVDEFVKQLK